MTEKMIGGYPHVAWDAAIRLTSESNYLLDWYEVDCGECEYSEGDEVIYGTFYIPANLAPLTIKELAEFQA